MRSSMALVVITAVTCGCGYFYKPIQPEGMELGPSVEEVRMAIDAYQQIACENSTICERIGHQAGSYEHYLKNIDDLPDDLIDSVDLMTFMFETDLLDAIEVDVRTFPGSIENQTVYVVHDQLDPAVMAHPGKMEILGRNTVEGLLATFILEKYYLDGRKIFIELKTEDKTEPLSVNDQVLVDRVVETIDRVLQTVDPLERDEIREQIGFVSFHLGALMAVHLALPGEATFNHGLISKSHVHSLHLILGTDNKLFQLVGTKLTDEIKRSAQHATWLTGVWLDPWVLRDPKQTVEDLQRLNRGLEVGLSTYFSGHDRFEDEVKGKGFRNVSGVIVEIDFGAFEVLDPKVVTGG